MDQSISSLSTVSVTTSWPSQEDSHGTGVDDELDVDPFHMFENPFQIEDLSVFDDATLQSLLNNEGPRINLEDLAKGLQGSSKSLLERIERSVSVEQRALLQEILLLPLSDNDKETARQRVLDNLFWELTYWKLPELYDELTAGESMNPGIFERLEPELRDKIVLDIATGTGRATFECLRCGAALIYAVDPAPGMLHILEQKLAHLADANRVVIRQGSFERLPLENNSVDIVLSCSAFSSAPGQGGEPGLSELWRVTKPGGNIVCIWPFPRDYKWFAERGFQYVAFPADRTASVHFRSVESALCCARLFYSYNKAVIDYILERQEPEVPFSLLGFDQPRDYCWLLVKKE
jgi:SAM-dependent methyltransferase